MSISNYKRYVICPECRNELKADGLQAHFRRAHNRSLGAQEMAEILSHVTREPTRKPNPPRDLAKHQATLKPWNQRIQAGETQHGTPPLAKAAARIDLQATSPFQTLKRGDIIPRQVNCPHCGKPSLALWCAGKKAVCDACFLLFVSSKEIASYQLRVSPRQNENNEWVQQDTPEFGFLREFVDAFLRPEKYPHLKPFVTKTPRSIDAVLKTMESMVPQSPIATDDLVELAEIRDHAIKRLKRDFALWDKGLLEVEFAMPVNRVYWELLKPTGDTWEELSRYFRHLENSRNEQYDASRIKCLCDLKPDKVYVGLASFKGYVVFCYVRGETAALECPRVGNALYLMKLDEWKFLSQQSKTQLLFQRPQDVERIIHSGSYEYEIRRRLANRGVE